MNASPLSPRRSIAAGLSLFLGGFTLLNLLGELRHSGFDANPWWIDLHPLPQTASRGILFLTALLFIAAAFKPPASRLRRWTTIIAALFLLLFTLYRSAGFYHLLLHGHLADGLPVPFTLLIALTLVFILFALIRPPDDTPLTMRHGLTIGSTLVATMVIFPLAQMYCFGKTDYRRPADVAVVFGARVYADGRCSQALADRVRTACKLYRNNLTPLLIFSGGPGDGDIDEPHAMRNMAMSLGVPDSAIILDSAGLNTAATVQNTAELFARLHTQRIIAVSHFYHLPRIKMTYQRQGLRIYTVPARETYILSRMPYLMAREVAALWSYYLRPLIP